MKKRITVVLAFVLASIMVFVGTAQISASGEETFIIPDNTPVTYGYLKEYMDEIKAEVKAEIIAQLTSDGVFDTKQTYEEVSASKGQMIILSADTEIIYRGGGAVAVTSSFTEGNGITDMSMGKEIFSGESLQYGRIYYSSAGDSKKAILIIGETAYFTIRGNYEII